MSGHAARPRAYPPGMAASGPADPARPADAGRIELRGLRCFGYHGVADHEQRDGQTFVVDVTVHADLSAAAASDDVADTIDYGELAVRVSEAVAATRFDLLEALADHLCELVLADARVAAVEVRVAKPDAPVPVALDEVAVTRRMGWDGGKETGRGNGATA